VAFLETRGAESRKLIISLTGSARWEKKTLRTRVEILPAENRGENTKAWPHGF
jgi:hypothetical protein